MLKDVSYIPENVFCNFLIDVAHPYVSTVNNIHPVLNLARKTKIIYDVAIEDMVSNDHFFDFPLSRPVIALLHHKGLENNDRSELAIPSMYIQKPISLSKVNLQANH